MTAPTAEQVAQNEVAFQAEAMRRIVAGTPVMIGLTATFQVIEFIAQSLNPEQRQAMATALQQVAERINAPLQ